MLDHRTLWKQDFSTVPAVERRTARYALQLFQGEQHLHAQLRDQEYLNALWTLTRPLLDPRALAACLPSAVGEEPAWLRVEYEDLETALQRALHEEDGHEQADDGDEPNPAERAESLRQQVRVFLKTLPGWVVKRLAEADGNAPTSTTAALLGEALGLDATAMTLLDYLEHRELSEPLRVLLRAQRHTRGNMAARINLERLARVLDLDRACARNALAKRAPLRALRLVEWTRHHTDLEDFLPPSDLLREVMEAAPANVDALLALLTEPAPAGAWGLDAFAHLAQDAGRLRAVLRQAATTGAVGVNALFHGAPGTGKTELARALADACGLTAYQVRSDDEDGDGLSREGRLSAYLVTQRLLAQRRDVVLIFDEVEDVFAASDNLFALLRGDSATGKQKGWMNRLLEDNPVPAIWIANGTRGMDPAFLRRFLLPLAFVTPPRSVRRQMAERHLGDCGLPPTLLDELAADPALAPAQLGAARRLLDLQPEAAPEPTVRAGVAALRSLLHGTPAPRRRAPATAFDVAYLNLSGGITPSAIAQALHREGRGSLCFYGLPGTGKTAFAEVLAEALDRELVARQASELMSPYVGETEQNLARLFRECDPTRTLLLLDEVDSFLADRRQAQRSWERTQVNELLQQMECFPGIFIAATNLMSGIDAAALRRFDFKLHFRALTPAQRRALFAREALGDAQAPVPPALARHLEGLEGLTPGDFANVCRQRQLLGEALKPEQFLRRLAVECRLKGEGVRAA
ncbi:AAA family ATPase [Thiorhodococcus mannitoliphagus]|uniref:AAA family ATPase n=1 Tax=Thiorhodococcus mannitoliphagus TaxID=329406 RepID=A0A6P1E3I0_9GAMM|nr:AAA family ATPase [Thiorhodococcus mannitoliphagus]NEX23052.1 AAA family ATPase [Thiorhodococcus mannitoliphagus]